MGKIKFNRILAAIITGAAGIALSACASQTREGTLLFAPTEAYPSPLPASAEGVLVSGQMCPNPDGLEAADLSSLIAFQVVEDFYSGDKELARRTSDPAYWSLLELVVRPADLSVEQIGQPRPARETPYWDMLATLCNEKIAELSWWVEVCPQDCAEAHTSSPALISHLFMVNRKGLWLVWATYP